MTLYFFALPIMDEMMTKLVLNSGELCRNEMPSQSEFLIHLYLPCSAAHAHVQHSLSPDPGAHCPQGSVVQVYPSGWDNGNDDASDEMAQAQRAISYQS